MKFDWTFDQDPFGAAAQAGISKTGEIVLQLVRIVGSTRHLIGLRRPDVRRAVLS